MRLRALVLEKFGHFTSRRLEFRPGARLHVVHGPNEAGKTSALAAVHALFFGVPERTPYDFLHKSAELRIGGDIETRDGRRLAFRRRKGRKRVLFDEAGAELADDVLQHYLGGLGEDVFTRAFGLDAEGLRRGARELLTSRGDVGESLMAAASGLRGLAGLRKDLDAEADRLFAPRASKDRLIYQILERHEAARKQAGELELGAGKWKKLNEDIAERAGRLDAIAARQREVLTRLNQLARLAGLRPLTGRIDAEEARLAALGDLPDLRKGFGAELAAAHERAAAAAGAVEKAETDCETIARELAGVSVNAGLVARGAEIVALFGKTEAYRNATRDLPRVQVESDGFGADLAEKATALGLADADDVEALQPTAAAQARVAELIRAGADLEGRLARNVEARAKEQEALARLEEASKTRGAVADPGPLREKLAAFGDIGAKAERLKQDSAALDREARSLAEDGLRLSPPARDLDALAVAALPAAPAIARFRKELDALAEISRDLRKQADARRAEIATLETRIAELSGGGPVPSPERIMAAREARAEAFAPVRAAAFAEEDAPHGAALASAVARFETAVSVADRLADEGARDASRVAAWANARLALAEKQEQAASCARDLARAGEKLARAAADWEALWAPAGVTPLPPAEMTGWLSSVGALLQRREKLATQRGRLEAEQADLAGLAAPLAALARDIGLDPLDGIDAGRQAARIAGRIRALAEPWDAARGDARAADDTRARVARLDREREELRAARDDWRSHWDEATRALNARAGATLAEARAALEIWSRTPALLRERKNRLGRVAGMQRDIEAFDHAAAGLVEALAPDLAALGAPAAIEALHDRLGEARSAETRRRQIERQQAVAAAALVRARASKQTADEALASLAAHAPGAADLAGLAERLASRDARVATLDDLRAQLAEQAGHGDEARLRAELAGFDADAADAERAGLAAENARLNDEANRVYAEKHVLERQRDEASTGSGAEVATQTRRNGRRNCARPRGNSWCSGPEPCCSKRRLRTIARPGAIR